jgi:hypothetical protein
MEKKFFETQVDNPSMSRTNAEVYKFGLYLLFPVLTLFVFNKPEFLNTFPTPSLDNLKLLVDQENKGLYKLPSSSKEVNDHLEAIKTAKQQK